MARGRPAHPMALAKLKYHRHKAQAKFRNIPFHFEFQQWYDWWLQHGIDKNDPNTTVHSAYDRMCMCRYNDQGAYETSNVYCDTSANNSTAQHDFHDHKPSKHLYRWGNWVTHYPRDLAEISGIHWRRIRDYYKAHEYESRMLKERNVLMFHYSRKHGPKRDAVWIYQGQEYTKKADLARVVGSNWRYDHLRKTGEIQRIQRGPTPEEYYEQNRKYPPFSEKQTKTVEHINKRGTA